MKRLEQKPITKKVAMQVKFEMFHFNAQFFFYSGCVI